MKLRTKDELQMDRSNTSILRLQPLHKSMIIFNQFFIFSAIKIKVCWNLGALVLFLPNNYERMLYTHLPSRYSSAWKGNYYVDKNQISK